MGFLYYGSSSFCLQIDDRALAHLKVVMLTLLRDGKSFPFSHAKSMAEGSGRDTLWVTPVTELRFHFHGSRPARLNETWLRAIFATASAPTGLHVVPETEAASALRGSSEAVPSRDMASTRCH
jgi:hypothetical protein